jgi:hypothetical protein
MIGLELTEVLVWVAPVLAAGLFVGPLRGFLLSRSVVLSQWAMYQAVPGLVVLLHWLCLAALLAYSSMRPGLHELEVWLGTVVFLSTVFKFFLGCVIGVPLAVILSSLVVYLSYRSQERSRGNKESKHHACAGSSTFSQPDQAYMPLSSSNHLTQLKQRVSELIERQRPMPLTAEETAELDDLLHAEHHMRHARARARQRLDSE